MKGHNHSGNGGNITIKGRQINVIVLILAFVAAVMGLMLLHKIRERRIYTILVKEKDHQIISLHLLLQKERDHIKEAKRKIQEMKAKIYSVRTQKMELDSKISEMQSTISSLKEEQKTLETSLEEKQNEIMFLRAKETEPHIETSEKVSLMETLKQKESEIGEFKHHVVNPTKIWSVSADDPSNMSLNSTNKFQHQVQRDEIINERNSDEVEGTKTEGLTLNEVKGNPNSNETDAKTAYEETEESKGEIEGISLHSNDAMKKESAYTSEAKAKRLRLRARQQRRGGVIHNRRFRMDGQRSGKYKRIIDEEMHKLGMHQDKSIKVKDELGQDGEMRENKRIGVNEQTERTEVNSTNESVGEMQADVSRNVTAADENSRKPGEFELSEKNVNNSIQVRLETNDDKSIDLSTEEEKITQKNEEAEGEGDYEELKAEQEAGKVDSGEETEELEF